MAAISLRSLKNVRRGGLTTETRRARRKRQFVITNDQLPIANLLVSVSPWSISHLIPSKLLCAAFDGVAVLEGPVGFGFEGLLGFDGPVWLAQKLAAKHH